MPYKTQFISETENIKATDTLVIVNPYVFSGEINKAVAKKFEIGDSIRHKGYIQDKYVTDNNRYDKEVAAHCENKYSNYFRHMPYRALKPSGNDNAVLYNELKKVELQLKDSLVGVYNMSDEMHDILIKYPGDLFLLTDLSEYYSTAKTRFMYNDITIAQFFVFKKENKHLVFYNYSNLGECRSRKGSCFDRDNWYEVNFSLKKFRKALRRELNK